MRQAQERVAEWSLKPTKFVTDMWPQVTLEPFQEEGLNELVNKGRVSIRSGHGVGKSALDAWSILWFILCYFPCRIGITAPTSTQLADVLHPEVGIWIRAMPSPYQSLLELKKDRLVFAPRPEHAFATFRTARSDKPEALQGLHSENMFVLVDEASGVDDIIFETAGGSLTGPNTKVLMTSNPTRTHGYFYDSHHKMRHLWHVIKVSCFDSSQVTQTYIEEQKTKYGEDSNVYLVRVLGEFPKDDDDVLIPLSLCEDAKAREVEVVSNMMPVWGLDVARFGTCKTALVKRQANFERGVRTWKKRDTMYISGVVLQEYEDCKSDEVPAEINVDSIGIGAGVVDRLNELGLPVRGVNVGETPSGKDRFNKLRDELWWRGREWLEQRNTKLFSDELIGELCSVKYKIMSNGKIVVERKEDMMKRGLFSPDIADAWNLTFAGADRRRENKDAYKRRKTRKRSGWTS